MIRPLKQFLARLVAHKAHGPEEMPASLTGQVAFRKGLGWKKKGMLSGVVLLTFFAAMELILAVLGVHPFRDRKSVV